MLGRVRLGSGRVRLGNNISIISSLLYSKLGYRGTSVVIGLCTI